MQYSATSVEECDPPLLSAVELCCQNLVRLSLHDLKNIHLHTADEQCLEDICVYQ